MTVFVYTFCILAVTFAVLTYTRWIWTYNQARRKGLLPLGKAPTLFDVRHFVEIGERDLAMYVYCDIFHCGHKKAKKAIDELERSLQEKNSQY